MTPKYSSSELEQSSSTKPTSISIHRPEKQLVTIARSHTPKQFRTTGILDNTVVDDDDDDYVRFVKSLGIDDSLFASLENEDEDFHISDIDEDEDEEDDPSLLGVSYFQANNQGDDLTKIIRQNKIADTPALSSPITSPASALSHIENNIYRDLEDELGSLLEEDMEAAVQSLMTSKKPTTPSGSKPNTPSPKASKASNKKKNPKAVTDKNTDSPTTPLRDAARQGTRAQVSYKQSQQLRRLLTRHYQLLIQQAILAVRAAHTQKAHKEKSAFLCGETADDLAEILDGAVGMLQDLDENRKDAIRNSIQLAQTSSAPTIANKGRRSLLSQFTESTSTLHHKDRRLTRSAFSRTLQQGGTGVKRTAFDIPGLVRLKESFSTIDRSVDGGVKGPSNILEASKHEEACRLVLRQAGANIDEGFVPGTRDPSENFCDAREFFGESFQAPCSEDQQLFLRRNRNLFTSGEDNLVLRGVNLYGEKQWILIADRYLPDRSVNIISQRYSKLCVMLYKAHGVHIDNKGNLREPPKLESVDDIDEEKIKKLSLRVVEPPAILNVHRWSLEEDISLLKAVPIMGHMWAELGARLIPHRDRGHLRKRYQVLERRVKATITRSSKGDSIFVKYTKPQASARKANAVSICGKPTISKSTTKSSSVRAGTRQSGQRKLPISAAKEAPMTIEKAAASLVILRPTNPIDSKTSKDEGEIRNNFTSNYKDSSTSSVMCDDLKTRMAKDPAKSKRKENSAAPIQPIRHKGKALPIFHSISSNRKSILNKRPLPKLPVKNYTPSKPLRVDSQLSGDLSLSRTAFENLVNGTNEEWSQMSKMKKILENDSESNTADAVAFNLSKSPIPSGLSRLPQMQLDTNSMSGLSILHSEASRQTLTPNEKKRPCPDPSESIMARVLEGASKTELFEKDELLDPSIILNSPKKRAKTSSSSLPPILPSTPSKSNFLADGTQIGLSPGFRSSPACTTRQTGGFALTSSIPFSPAPSSVMRLVNDRSVDESMFCDFRISEESRQELDSSPAKQHDPTPPPLTPSKNSLFAEHLMADDFEAVSALGALSNSPFRQRRGKEEEENDRTTVGKRSLFATVVGGIKNPKKQLQF